MEEQLPLFFQAISTRRIKVSEFISTLGSRPCLSNTLRLQSMTQECILAELFAVIWSRTFYLNKAFGFFPH